MALKHRPAPLSAEPSAENRGEGEVLIREADNSPVKAGMKRCGATAAPSIRPHTPDKGMTEMNLPPISPMINIAFNVSRAKYRAEHTAWTNLSFVLSGRFNLPVAMMNIQRQGDLDLLLRCIEDEFEANKATEIADTTGSDMTFHYQLTLSEIWTVGCYEILRAFRQRDQNAVDAGLPTSGVSEMNSFKSIFADFHLLRIPMTKFEIANDKRMKEPLPLQGSPANNDASDQTFYDSKDPARYHIMPSGMSPRGSASWVALDHLAKREYLVERRDLAERLLAMGNEIVPAGLLEAQERAAQQHTPAKE